AGRRGPRAPVAALPCTLPLRNEDRPLVGPMAEEELRYLVRRIDRIESEEPAENRAGPLLDRVGLREGLVLEGARRRAAGLRVGGGGRRRDVLDAPHEPEERDERRDRRDHKERARRPEAGAEARHREQDAAEGEEEAIPARAVLPSRVHAASDERDRTRDGLEPGHRSEDRHRPAADDRPPGELRRVRYRRERG